MKAAHSRFECTCVSVNRDMIFGMNTISQFPIKTTHIAGFGLLTLLASLSIPLGTAHALSCLNPSEMIDEYVSDERFAIARVEVGELETTGDEHDQAVSVQENLKGMTGIPVSFTYDETWQYLCAGQPAAAGTEAIYVTSEGRVTQVIDLDTPLYDSLMTALADAPETPTSPTEETTKRTLLERIVGLLQQVLSLLQGDAASPVIEPAPVASAAALIGMTTTEAEAYATENDLLFRIVEIDGEPQPVTKDYRPGRINASVEDGVVVSYTVEGEGMSEEEAGQHDDIIGMTRSEAEAYAEANEVAFRVGRIDDEFLPVTMDYRPGRITAEIEDEVIVVYSVE
jgi:hypothetical protein